MSESQLHTIENFTSEERKLLLYKLKTLVNERETKIHEPTSKRLVAYIKTDSPIDISALREDLKKKLPEYMIPAVFHTVNEFPVLPNGKIDKKALAYSTENGPGRKEALTAQTELEKQLVEIWEEILGHSPIYSNDDFFEIGGDSMLSIKMFWLIEKRLKTKLPPTTLLSSPTVTGIARAIQNFNPSKKQDWEYLVPYKKSGNKPPLFCIHGGEGHVLFYKSLPEYTDVERPVYFVQPKGINGVDLMHNSIEEMSRDYILEITTVQPDGPYNLLFYCCSALVVEMAKQLQAVDKDSNLIVIDSSAKNIMPRTPIGPKERFARYFRSFSKYPLKTLKASLKYRYQRHIEPAYIKYSNDKVAQRLQRIRLQLRRLQNRYKWQQFDTRVTLIQAEIEHPEIMKRGIESWNYWCKPGVDVIVNPGNHYTIFAEPHVRSLGQNIEKVCL